MGNIYLEYYGKHNISPVNQYIDDIEVHYGRREKLYRQCGIPTIVFKNAEILEIGPGGGYNTLAFFHWNCGHVDLVEANEKGIRDMYNLFAEQCISEEKYQIFPCQIEDYKTDKKYEIIIAEGFVQHLPNYQKIIAKLQSLVADNGIIVITCSEYMSWFIEIMKRLVGQFLIKDIESYEEKVKYLTELYEPQLSQLRGVSRPARDWVQDTLLFDNSVFFTRPLNIAQAIGYFQEEYDVLGTSPQMFIDYSWYKDIWFDYKADFIKQYDQKKLSLLMANMPEQILNDEQTKKLTECIERIIKLAIQYENGYEDRCIKNIIGQMYETEKELGDFDKEFAKVFHEIIDSLMSLMETGTVNFQQYPHFFQNFGRTQQYVSFIKK